MLRTLFIFVHLIGLAFGVGGVTANAILMIKTRSNKEFTPIIMKAVVLIGKLVFFGLVLLTVSGIGFLYLGYPLARLTVKLFLVGALWIEGPLVHYFTSRLAKLVPNPSQPASPEFLSIKRKTQVIGMIGVILWYMTTALGVLLRT